MMEYVSASKTFATIDFEGQSACHHIRPEFAETNVFIILRGWKLRAQFSSNVMLASTVASSQSS